MSANPMELSHEARTRRPAQLADPGDAVLIETMIRYGQEPSQAGLWRHMADGNQNQGTYGRRFLRFCALNFWRDTVMAGRGDKAARDRVEALRAQWYALREREAEQALEAAELDADRKAGRA